ncbi:protein shisa-2-like [Rhineura floridana]|uniref:protein shisa-2-like n=1 Tax=Rhineura floridana TaxID=261503 RepID=UPI002AC83DE6|nr:protein shisa-2-like [Rhineura floridana]
MHVCSMTRAFLSALLLLLLFLAQGSVSTSPKGDWCWVWQYGGPAPLETFQCPERDDHADATYCCGTCNRPVCCSSEKARLDQRLCRSSSPPKAPLPSPITVQFLHDFVWSCFGVILFVVFCAAVQWFYYRFWRCLKSCKEEPQHTELEDLDSSSCTDPPPPYSNMGRALPWISAVDPGGPWILPPVSEDVPLVQFFRGSSGVLGDRVIFAAPSALPVVPVSACPLEDPPDTVPQSS